MQVVLDTNVLASGLVGFSQPTSTPGQLLHGWQEGLFDLVVAEPILSELANTLATPYFRQRITAEQRAAALTLLRNAATLTPLTVAVHGVATHPEDDRVLAAAVSAQVDYLVSGDKQLQNLGTYQGVRIVSPRAFLDFLRASEDA